VERGSVCAGSTSIPAAPVPRTGREGSTALPVAAELPATSLLQVEDLTVGYRVQAGEDIVAVNNVSFRVAAGEAVGLLGESGCGKTTIGLALLGLLPPNASTTRGSAIFRGKNLLELGERELREVRGAAISMVFQEPGSALNPVLRVGKQIEDVIRGHRPLPRERAREETAQLLTQVGFSEEICIAAAYPHQLSGGQQQRIAIAQAIAARPALLIADEPTTALDRATQLDILALLTRLRAELRLSLLLITHDPDALAHTVGRVMVMRDGRIVEQGLTHDLIRNSEDDYTQTLVNSSAASSSHRCSVWGSASLQAEASFEPPSSRSSEPSTLLSAVGLRKSYLQGRWPSARRRQVRALEGVDLKLRAGSTLALIGASGSGKSTLARCLACLERPNSGEIWFGSTNLAALSNRQLIPFRRQIQMIFQDPGSSLNPRFNAVEIISEPLLTITPGDRKQSRDRALELMELVGLQPDWGRRLPHQFSAGQRRRLAIARALALEPRILILDEALTGLDLPIQAQIADLLQGLQARLSLSYLYISHDLGMSSRLADEVIVLHQGKIVETTSPSELLENPQSLPANNLVRASLELCRSGG
jgi:peptide/nickel transport system ATP-binding protein